MEIGDSISNFWEYNIFIAYLNTLILEDKIDEFKKVTFIVKDKSQKQYLCKSEYSAHKMIKEWQNINYL